MRDAADKREQVRAASDIVQVVGSHVPLRKSGKNYVGVCPFHQEKTPSFSVSAEKKLYYCFGCHAGGDVFDFVMRHRGLDFHAALNMLASRAGIELAPLSPQARARQESIGRLAAINAVARDFFARALLCEPGAVARNYLTSRHIPAVQAKARRLGFGHTTQAFFAYLQRHELTPEHACEAGLLTEDKRHHLFEQRLVFPITDADGRVCGFGARRLGDDKSQPKYINSREAGLFSKRRLLYGFCEAQGAIRQHKAVVLVEGYTDVLAAHRSEVTHAVALLGTAFTTEHARLCGRLVKEATVLLDADAAGLKAAKQSSLALLESGIAAKVATLPPGEDPDTLVSQRGGVALRAAIAAAQPAVALFLDQALPSGAMSIEEKAEALREVAPLLLALGQGLQFDLYLERLVERVGLPREDLLRHLRRGRQHATATSRPKAPAAAPLSGGAASETPEKVPQTRHSAPRPQVYELELLRELLLYPQLRARFGDIADFAVTPTMQSLLEGLAEPDTPLMQVIEQHVVDRNWQKRLCAVRPLPPEGLEGGDARAEKTFAAVLDRFKALHLKVEVQHQLKQIEAAEARGEATESLLRRKQELAAKKRALFKRVVTTEAN